MGEAALVMTVGRGRKGEEKDTSDLQQHHETNPFLQLGRELVALLYCIKFLLPVAGGWEGKDGHEMAHLECLHCCHPPGQRQEVGYPKATPTALNLPCAKSEKPAWVWAQWMTQTVT